MKIIILHDTNNPEKIIPMDAEDFSVALPYLNGSCAVRTKSSDSAFMVKESTEEILKMLNEAANS